MKEKLIRLAKFNQRWMGALLLTLAYFVSLGPAAMYQRAARWMNLTRKQEGGWRKTERPTLRLADLEEQS